MKDSLWYTIDDASSLDTPALLFFPERITENIFLLKDMISDPSLLRPHIKTHKTREIVRLQIEAGINKFKCATISEAELLALSGAEDVLMAYQPVGPKMERFLSLIEKFPVTKFSCLIDNMDIASQLSAAARKRNTMVPVYIDLNVGMNRTGIPPGAKALELYQLAVLLQGINPRGVHFYDGHIRDKDLATRKQHCLSVLKQVRELVKIIEQNFGKAIIVAGGSPSFPIYAAQGDIECSPGTFALWDAGYQEELPEQKFKPGGLIATRVISIPEEGKICLDMGYKSIASENPIARRFHFVDAPDLKVLSQSEEHLVMETTNNKWKVGDLLYALPVHICPTCALYECAVIIKGNKIRGNWKIAARDRKITI